MSLREPFIAEFSLEALSTRKILERVPEEFAGWKPHPRSSALFKLATHVAEIPLWTMFVLAADELNLAGDNLKPAELATKRELLAFFNSNIDKAMASLENASDDDLMRIWTLKKGDHVIISMPKTDALRRVVASHQYHHRGQLSVYLRLLDILVPGMYGASADD